MIITYDIHELVPYINWVYFFFAWQVKNEDEKACLRQEAEMLLTQWEGRYHAYGLFELFEANADGDDIVGDRSPESGEYLVCDSNRVSHLIYACRILYVL